MTEQWIMPAALGGLAALTLLVVLALLRTRSRTAAEIGSARAETARLRHELAELQHRLLTPPAARESGPEYRITGLSDEDPATLTAPVDRALFADLVLRETVVRAASLAHGVRRALSAETRDRVRLEVRREVRRARKQRRADLRDARRQWPSRGPADDEFAA